MGQEIRGFKKAMKKIIYLLRNKKRREANFVCALTLSSPDGKVIYSIKKLKGNISKLSKDQKALVMTQFLFQKVRQKHLVKSQEKKKMKIDHRYLAYSDLKKKIKAF